MADKIATLPVDSTPLNHAEINLMNALFEEENSNLINKALSGLRDVFIASAVVFLILLPFVDDAVRKYFPVTVNNPYILVLIKTIAFALLFFLVSNATLVKASS
jgi:hypothetical protein